VVRLCVFSSFDLNYGSCTTINTFRLPLSCFLCLTIILTQVLGAAQLWKVRAPNACRFHAWLVLLHRCWTQERHHCHGLSQSDVCPLCAQEPELVHHMVMRVVFCPRRLGLGFFSNAAGCSSCHPLGTPSRLGGLGWGNWLSRLVIALFVSCVMWNIWLHRNACVFRNIAACVGSRRRCVELAWWSIQIMTSETPILIVYTSW
jgi:hypothetical protein